MKVTSPYHGPMCPDLAHSAALFPVVWRMLWLSSKNIPAYCISCVAWHVILFGNADAGARLYTASSGCLTVHSRLAACGCVADSGSLACRAAAEC